MHERYRKETIVSLCQLRFVAELTLSRRLRPMIIKLVSIVMLSYCRTFRVNRTNVRTKPNKVKETLDTVLSVC